MHELDTRGLANKTLVVITSDHGESLGQHHLETHGRALYWELIHVPLMLYFPGHVPGTMRIERPVTNAGIPATILDLLGEDETTLPGPTLGVLWKKSQVESEMSDPLSELAHNKYPGKHDQEADQLIPTATSGALRTLITEQWQLIVHEKLGDQIYDRTRDPGESHNLINTPDGLAVALNLKSKMQGVLTTKK